MLQLFGLARVGFCVADQNGVILSADRTYAEIMHYNSISSGTLGISDVALPEDCSRLTEAMSKVSSSGSSLVYRRPAICGDGEVIWVENRLSLLHSAEDKRFLVATREIDEPSPPEVNTGLFFPAKTCAAYVADLANELSAMAGASQLSMTAEVLKFAAEMVQAEAQTLEADVPMLTH